jgi:hypothetical protein
MFYKKARNILLATLAVYLIYLGIFQYEFESSHRVYLKSSNDAPFIFVGGYPRSGTTLMVYIFPTIFISLTILEKISYLNFNFEI